MKLWSGFPKSFDALYDRNFSITPPENPANLANSRGVRKIRSGLSEILEETTEADNVQGLSSLSAISSTLISCAGTILGRPALLLGLGMAPREKQRSLGFVLIVLMLWSVLVR